MCVCKIIKQYTRQCTDVNAYMCMGFQFKRKRHQGFLQYTNIHTLRDSRNSLAAKRKKLKVKME